MRTQLAIAAIALLCAHVAPAKVARAQTAEIQTTEHTVSPGGSCRIDFQNYANDESAVRDCSIVFMGVDDAQKAVFRLHVETVGNIQVVRPELIQGLAYCRVGAASAAAQQPTADPESRTRVRLYYPILWTRSVDAGTAGTDFIARIDSSATAPVYFYLETEGSTLDLNAPNGTQHDESLGDTDLRVKYEITKPQPSDPWQVHSKSKTDADADAQVRKRAREIAEDAGLQMSP